MANKTTLHEKLSMIQSSLVAPKNQYNSFGKYNYRSCEDILEGLKPLIKEHSVSVTLSDDIIQVGSRIYLKATATITDGIDSFSVSAMAREPEKQSGMAEPQITGSASSYARKYALNGLFSIDDTKDHDTMDNKNNGAINENNNSESVFIDEKIHKELRVILQQKNLDYKNVCGAWGFKTLMELRKDSVINFKKWVNGEKI